ncbi:MAG: DUF1176 domain-containing protein [Rhodothermales bacterium]|nr:DUF1176 domain-containing protein [Rhodothermales bacterium]MBO6778067.1 DUF1176 domain-containing protein [Rhodothermales bacterium]
MTRIVACLIALALLGCGERQGGDQTVDEAGPETPVESVVRVNPTATMEDAAALLTSSFADDCIDREPGEEPMIPDESVDVVLADGRTARLFRMSCALGAYNSSEVWLRQVGDGQLEALTFRTPEVTYAYADEDETQLTSPPEVTGFRESNMLVNSSFDPESGQINSFIKWRGLGDAWEAGTWTLAGSEFELTRYVVDPTWSANAAAEDGTIDETSWEIFPAVRQQ